MKYTIDSDKLARVLEIAQIDEATASEWLFADWEDEDEHQEWLDDADAEEIADWLAAVMVDED